MDGFSEVAGWGKRDITMILQVFSTFEDFAETREASSLSLSFRTIHHCHSWITG